MSTFTRFSAIEQLQYDTLSSKMYKKDIYAVIPGFRYYIGTENSDKYVDVESGFRTDGATIPRMFWWLLPPLGEYSQATTLHDKLCQTYEITQVINGTPTQVKIIRKDIDLILAEAMDVLEVTKWKRNFIMAGVNIYRTVANPTTPKTPAQSFS